MCPLELVATPTDSPRVSPAGTFRKFGTDVYWISGTFCAVAFCCANAGRAQSIKAMANADARLRFIWCLPGKIAVSIPNHRSNDRIAEWRLFCYAARRTVVFVAA